MIIQSSRHSLKTVPRLAAVVAAAAVLAACGDGPMENKGINAAGNGSSALYEDWKNGQGEQNGQQGSASTPSNTSNTSGAGEDGKTEQQRAAEAEAAARAAAEAAAREQMSRTALELAIEMQEDPVRHPGKKMLIVGLDNSSLASNNQAWLNSPHLAGLSDDQKRNYVSLSGKDLYEYYRRSCPVGSYNNDAGDLHDPNPVYRCIAGLYYGKNSEGKVCFTSIGWNGEVRHVNDVKIVSEFKLGEVRRGGVGPTIPPMPTEFTRADAGGNMFMILNGAARSPNPPLDLGFTFAFDGGWLSVLSKSFSSLTPRLSILKFSRKTMIRHLVMGLLRIPAS